MSDRYDAIVVGVGSMGSAACHHLAMRGLRVLGLEQFDIPHALGSHHGGSRVIRLSYYEHPDYVPLLLRAWTLWQELEQRSGQKLLYDTGMLVMGPPTPEGVVARSIAAAEQFGLPFRRLTSAQVAKEYPAFEIPADFQAMFDVKAGFVLPELAVATHACAALEHGAELHGREKVLGWEATDRGASVRTDRGAYQAERLVFASGAWSSQLVQALGVELTVTRQVMGWVWPRRPADFGLGSFPTWGIDGGAGGLFYGFPMLPGQPGLKVARHRPAGPTDPDQVDRHLQPGDEADFREGLERFLPSGAGPTLAARVCLYTNSPDGHFIIDHLPGQPRVIIACGFSGHGFKFAPVVGEALAEMVQQGATRHPIGFLGLDRFRR